MGVEEVGEPLARPQAPGIGLVDFGHGAEPPEIGEREDLFAAPGVVPHFLLLAAPVGEIDRGTAMRCLHGQGGDPGLELGDRELGAIAFLARGGELGGAAARERRELIL